MKLINLSDITFPKVAIDAEDILSIEEAERKAEDVGVYNAKKERAIKLIEKARRTEFTREELAFMQNQWGSDLAYELCLMTKDELENLYDSINKDDLEEGIKSKITTKDGKVYTISVSINEFFKKYDL